MKITSYYVKATEDGPQLIKMPPSHRSFHRSCTFLSPEEAWNHFEQNTLAIIAYHKAQAEFLMKNLKLLKEMKNETQKEPPG
jgi:hypothetical protein